MPRKKAGPKAVDITLVERRAQTGIGRILAPQVVRKVERRYQVLDMRKRGYTITEIAEALDCDPNTVRADIQLVLSSTIKEMTENTEEARQLEIERYDAILKMYFDLAIAGNLAATAIVLQVSQQRRKLLALDVPEARFKEESGVREYVGVNVDLV